MNGVALRAVTLKQLTVHYRGVPALQNLSGCFEQGSLTAVVGANGCGKSTLLKSIARRLPAQARSTAGAVQCNMAAGRVAYLAQRSEIDTRFPMTVLECVLLGYWQQAGPFDRMSPAMLQRAGDALHTVGLPHLAASSLEALSSGQLQRVLFARLMVQEAELILLDEPFNAVDATTTRDLLVLVQQLHQQGRTLIAVLHDAAQVQQVFPQTLELTAAGGLHYWGATAARADTLCAVPA